MIPRYDGLVPAIRGPASTTTAAAAASAARKAPAVVRHYVIQPSTTTTITTTAKSPVQQGGTTGVTSGEREYRLYTFLPSSDVAAPPKELRVASHFFGDTEAASAAGVAVAEADEDSDSGSSSNSDDEKDDNDFRFKGQRQQGRDASSAASNSVTALSGRARRRRRRGREPMRLEYQGIMDTNRANPYADRVVKMASTPAAAYRHLSCVLLKLPASWRDPQSLDSGEGSKGDGSSPPSGLNSSLISCSLLAQPVLQLWGERKEANAVGHSSSTGSGISSSWYSEQSTKISKKDWKTMDAVDAEMHRPTNWSDGDGGDDEEDGHKSNTAETAMTARERKRAKAEATGQAVRAFLAGTKEALRRQNSMKEVEEGSTRTTQPSPSPAALAAAMKTVPKPAEMANSGVKGHDAPSPSPRRLTVVVPTALRTSSPPPSVALSVQNTPMADPPAPINANKLTSNMQGVEETADAATLPTLASAVLKEVQEAEGRATASLMELQKRILKQLPDFATMNQKIKSPETKKEAVEWFQMCQRDLRVWLQGHGHMIGSDNTVTFGG
jgi:hypothetical protein